MATEEILLEISLLIVDDVAGHRERCTLTPERNRATSISWGVPKQGAAGVDFVPLLQRNSGRK